MARSTFGASSGDTVVQAPAPQAPVLRPVVNSGNIGTFWSAQTGGTQYTDLLDAATGQPITGLSTDQYGRVRRFQGPDGILSGWADFGAGRVLLVDVSAAIAAASAPADSAVATAVGTAGSQAQGALDSRYTKLGAPSVVAPPLFTAPISITTAGTNAVLSQNAATGVFYGKSTANGHYITSTDLVTWTDRTYSPSNYTPNLLGFQFDETYMYAYSDGGKLWRAPLDVFNNWTALTIPGLPAGTTGRPGSLCAVGGGVLLYGNYNANTTEKAHIWRSTDAGATWSMVWDSQAKHVHSIRRNPADGIVWASIGDFGFPGMGLYKSTDQGATWTLMSSNEYGIDMVFVPASARYPALVVLEGDGLNRPHLVAFPQNGKPGDKTFPLVWFTGAPSDPQSTRGTTRGICLTPNGDVIYWTTTENATVGSRAGLWVAQGPDLTRSVLLYETTGAEPVTYTRTFASGTTTANYTWTFTTPTFGSY